MIYLYNLYCRSVEYMKHIIKTIGFAPELIPLVQEESKTLTYRLGDKYDFLKIGDTIQVDDSLTGIVFGEVVITEKSQTTFGLLPIDRKGHEIYLSKEEQREVFAGYYGRAIEDNDRIIVLGFLLLKE